MEEMKAVVEIKMKSNIEKNRNFWQFFGTSNNQKSDARIAVNEISVTSWKKFQLNPALKVYCFGFRRLFKNWKL